MITVNQTKAAAVEKEKVNAQTLAQIAAEESKQARAIREHLLGDVTARDRIQLIEDNIKALRTQLQR
jgi:ABC-type sulfate transport system substrate-binding protein